MNFNDEILSLPPSKGVIVQEEVRTEIVDKQGQLSADFAQLPRRDRRNQKTLDEWHQERTPANRTLLLIKELG